MVKILIDPGHGGKDPGAVGHGLQEKELTLKISLKIRDILLREYKNVEVRLSRTTDVYLTLAERARLANVWGADFFLSIHINATPSGYGYEDIIFNGAVNQRTVQIQSAINPAVIKETGWRNRGKKRKNLQVLRDSKMPALLTESGFIDNPEDAKLLKEESFIDKIARGHVNGIVETFGLKRKLVAMDQPKNEGVIELYQPTSKAIKESTEEVLKQLEAGENGLSPHWRKKLNDGTLTVSDAVGLQFVAIQRGLLT